MGLLNFKRATEGARFRAIKKFWWADRVLAVGDVILVEDPAMARELCNAGRLDPVDDGAREHLRRPAKWIEPRNTSVVPRNSGVFSRERPWRSL